MYDTFEETVHRVRGGGTRNTADSEGVGCHSENSSTSKKDRQLACLRRDSAGCDGSMTEEAHDRQ